MFVPVVVVLFLCNLTPVSLFVVLVIQGKFYREMFLGMYLSTAFNSAVNLPIYYARGSSFREEIRNALPDMCKRWLNKPLQENETNTSGTGKSSSN